MDAMTTTDIILEELRALRTDYNAHARDTGERLAALEAQMHDLCGNGQPGRIRTLELIVERLQAWRWYLIGASAAVSTIVAGAAWLIAEVVK
jgi:hypothetical protein